MKQILLALVVLLSLPSCITAPQRIRQKPVLLHDAIVTITSMSQLEQYVRDDSIVLFDLDHTVFEGAYLFGHANWFYGRVLVDKAKGIDEETSIKNLFPIWLASQERTSVKPVEALTPSLIKRLQARGIKVMGLTARQTPLIRPSLRQLSEIDVDFRSSSLPPVEFVDGEFAAPVKFADGIIFTTEFVKKSDVLKTYFDRLGYRPRHIVFVDDSKKHVEDLVRTFSLQGVSIVGVHYPVIAMRKQSWDQTFAEELFRRCLDPKTEHLPECR